MLCIAALAQDKPVLEPTGHWPDKSDICEPIGDFGFSFDERIAAVDGAEGMIMRDGEIMARGPIRIVNNALGGISWAIISFTQDGEELILPNDYKECRVVIPAGTLWLEDDPDVKNEELRGSLEDEAGLRDYAERKARTELNYAMPGERVFVDAGAND